MVIDNKSKQLTKNDLSELGGKAYNLYKIKGVRHAKFFVLESSFFDKMPSVQVECLRLIKQKIAKKIKKNKKYAIRSSAVGEDSNEHSFAGIMESFLNVDCDDIPIRVLDCYNSAFSKRAISYRKANGLDFEKNQIRSAVIVQEMVDSDYAGVINTINPITNNPDEVFISVVKGLGEQLVLGNADSTDFTVDDLGIKTNNSGFISNKLINRLFDFACVIQSQCDRFQDIEFAIKKGKIYFLQTRDIVPYKDYDLTKPKTVLDNSNIIESFCGPVSPLTFSFAKQMYKNVYTQALKQSRVSKKLIDSLEPYLDNLIVYHKHRIYYNLNSWYKITGVYPNAKTSTRRMERMMGFETGMKSKRLKMNLRDTIKFVFNFLKRLKNIDKDSQKFLTDFYHQIYPFSVFDFAGYCQKQLADIYFETEKKTLPWYTAPVVNDNGAMIAYHKLTKFVSKLDIKDKEGFISSLFINLGNVESTLSASMFYDIVDIILSDKATKSDFAILDSQELFDKYAKSALGSQIKVYIDKFGARVTDELKLETVTMVQDPLILYSLLKTHIKNNLQRPKREKAEVIKPNLTKLKQKKFSKLVDKTAYFIRNRERLRLTRTHTFGAIRNILIRLGKIFFGKGLLECEGDIFYLEKQEVFELAYSKSILKPNEIKKLIADRKAAYDKSLSIEPSSRIVFYDDKRLDVLSAGKETDGLKGIPSGAGKITQKVKLILDPKSAVINGEIILTTRTDPGWITLFPLCSGLIVEYGSVLSHSAVMAREMGIPAVVGLKGATRLIKDGSTVTLDAIKGEVIVHE